MYPCNLLPAKLTLIFYTVDSGYPHSQDRIVLGFNCKQGQLQSPRMYCDFSIDIRPTQGNKKKPLKVFEIEYGGASLTGVSELEYFYKHAKQMIEFQSFLTQNKLED